MANFGVLVFWPKCQPKNPKPQTQRLAFRPGPQTLPNPNPKPEESLQDPTLRAPWPPPTPFGTTLVLGLASTPLLAVLVLLWLWLLWLLLVRIPGKPCARPPNAGPFLRRTAQNFAFFLTSRSHFRSFSVSLGVFSLHFGGVLKAGTLKCARLGSRACEAPAALGRPTLRDPTLRGPIFLGFGAQPFFCCSVLFLKEGQMTETPIWAKVGFGQSRFY